MWIRHVCKLLLLQGVVRSLLLLNDFGHWVICIPWWAPFPSLMCPPSVVMTQTTPSRKSCKALKQAASSFNTHSMEPPSPLTNCSLTSYHPVVCLCMNAFIINVHANHSKHHPRFCTALDLPNACLLRLSCLCCSLLSLLGWRFASWSGWVGPAVFVPLRHVHVAMFFSIHKSLFQIYWMYSTYTHMYNMYSKQMYVYVYVYVYADV
jgi:hypothetical protein